jgi:hypothetical protein
MECDNQILDVIGEKRNPCRPLLLRETHLYPWVPFCPQNYVHFSRNPDTLKLEICF